MRTTTPNPDDKPAHESFTRNADGSRTCIDCGQTFPGGPFGVGGDVMRSHRRRTHGETHPTPGVCDA
jgi:hypothetical protein